MNIAYRFALGLALLVSLPGQSGKAQGPQPPRVETSVGVEVGKYPLVSSATIVCGPLEQNYVFNPQTYGKTRGDAPIIASNPPLVLYACDLNTGFFRLASALDALAAKNPRWANSFVIVIDEKGAHQGGYSVEEMIQRRASLRQLVARNHISHLSFFLSAPGANLMKQRLKLTETQDALLAVFARPDASKENQAEQEKPKRAVVQSIARLDSSQLTAKTCKETVTALAALPESK